MVASRTGAVVAAVAWVCTLAVAAEPARMDRYQLLEFHDANGAVQPVTSADEWQRRRAEILAGMQEVMGELPSRDQLVPLDPQVVEEVDAGTHVRRLVTYQSEAGSRTPAYLCIPKDVLAEKRRAPAVLCLHPTDNQVGHQVVVGLGGRANRQYAAELAARGYVTVSPSYPHLANYWPNLEQLGYASGTMKAIWDNMPPWIWSRRCPAWICRRSGGHRPLAGRPQRDVHRRVRPAHCGRGVQLRVRLVPRLLRRSRT